MKQQEIERKFLVKGDGWRGRAEGVLFRQGYIARTQDRTVRVRVAGEDGTLTIKYRGEGIARSEFEYRIPLDEAQALLDGLDPGEVIEKMRFTFEQNGETCVVYFQAVEKSLSLLRYYNKNTVVTVVSK